MNKLIGLIFAAVCISTSALSNSIMGAGMWFWVIIIVGVFAAISQYYPMLRGVGSGFAVLLSVVSICAVVLGLVASTIGGSFKIENSLALLLFLFFIIFILGILLGYMYKKSLKSQSDFKA